MFQSIIVARDGRKPNNVLVPPAGKRAHPKGPCFRTLVTHERLTGATPYPPILSLLIIRYTKIKTSELNSNIDLKHNKSH